jgi:patatin-related protein
MAPGACRYQPTQEVRLAVVMFGGVSLAIYMNGIAQELLRAVTATAPSKPPDEHPDTALIDPATLAKLSTERVYRKLGQLLYHGRSRGTPPGAEVNPEAAIRTRIVIDILSGTSAGGINAVYLAKALVNHQSLEMLHQLWLTQADIDTLLNDQGSDLGMYPSRKPKTSLLNSQRMYGILLQAFEGMDSQLQRPPGYSTPLANELDLFVTTTDLNGIATPIQLADNVIKESVHKAHFRFMYGPHRLGKPNDFVRPYNPMLAFAARSTSSFPVAFEPMKFEDVGFRVPGLPEQVTQNQNHLLRKFFTQFERYDSDHVIPFARRPLADGGYLNNKPFSFAIEVLRFREASLPVSRKLLFLDPFPELDRQVRQGKQDFNFVENSMDAATTLPRYQTIREDIERLNQHNRQMHKAKMLAADIERDLPDFQQKCLERKPNLSYPALDLDDMIAQYGDCYVVYHRRRVSSVTDDLALLVTRVVGFRDDSDELFAIRLLVHAWRRDKFAARRTDGMQTENRFLFEFDMGYRLRRLDYVRSEIDARLGAARDETSQVSSQAILREFAGLPKGRLIADLLKCRAAVELARNKLSKIREQLWLFFEGQTVDEETAQLRTELRNMIAEFLEYADLEWIMAPVTDEECQARATYLYKNGRRGNQPEDAASRPVGKAIADAAEKLAGILKNSLTDASDTFLDVLNLDPDRRALGPVETDVVARSLWIRYQYFDCRDILVFPAQCDGVEGEGCLIEIYRISPLDAVRLRTKSDPSGENKLAGAALMAFGAFLSEEWRTNDIMWGRLDGAERIVKALLPDEEDEQLRNSLIEEAFEIILDEEFSPHQCGQLIQPLLDYLKSQVGEDQLKQLTADEFLRQAQEKMGGDCPMVVKKLLEAIPNNADRLAMFRSYYVRPADPSPRISIQRIRRALGIFSDMLDGLDGGKGLVSKIGGWIGSIGATVTRFVEFSLPGTLASTLFRHWIYMLYGLELLLIVIGALVYKEVETAGWIGLILTGILHTASSWVGRFFRRDRARLFFRGHRWTIGLLIVVLVVVPAGVSWRIAHCDCPLPEAAWKTPLRTIIHQLRCNCLV